MNIAVIIIIIIFVIIVLDYIFIYRPYRNIITKVDGQVRLTVDRVEDLEADMREILAIACKNIFLGPTLKRDGLCNANVFP